MYAMDPTSDCFFLKPFALRAANVLSFYVFGASLLLLKLKLSGLSASRETHSLGRTQDATLGFDGLGAFGNGRALDVFGKLAILSELFQYLVREYVFELCWVYPYALEGWCFSKRTELCATPCNFRCSMEKCFRGPKVSWPRSGDGSQRKKVVSTWEHLFLRLKETASPSNNSWIKETPANMGGSWLVQTHCCSITNFIPQTWSSWTAETAETIYLIPFVICCAFYSRPEGTCRRTTRSFYSPCKNPGWETQGKLWVFCSMVLAMFDKTCKDFVCLPSESEVDIDDRRFWDVPVGYMVHFEPSQLLLPLGAIELLLEVKNDNQRS